MKRPDSPVAKAERFHAPIRHYHRIKTKDEMSWDEWIDGRPGHNRLSAENLRKWLKITVGILCLATLGAVIVGLVIELS